MKNLKNLKIKAGTSATIDTPMCPAAAMSFFTVVNHLMTHTKSEAWRFSRKTIIEWTSKLIPGVSRYHDQDIAVDAVLAK